MGKFKLWMEFNGAATTAIHGGFYDISNKFTNDTMPVRSKYVTQSKEFFGKKIDIDKIWGVKKSNERKTKSNKTKINKKRLYKKI